MQARASTKKFKVTKIWKLFGKNSNSLRHEFIPLISNKKYLTHLGLSWINWEVNQDGKDENQLHDISTEETWVKRTWQSSDAKWRTQAAKQ